MSGCISEKKMCIKDISLNKSMFLIFFWSRSWLQDRNPYLICNEGDSSSSSSVNQVYTKSSAISYATAISYNLTCHRSPPASDYSLKELVLEDMISIFFVDHVRGNLKNLTEYEKCQIKNGGHLDFFHLFQQRWYLMRTAKRVKMFVVNMNDIKILKMWYFKK